MAIIRSFARPSCSDKDFGTDLHEHDLVVLTKFGNYATPFRSPTEPVTASHIPDEPFDSRYSVIGL